MKKYLLVAAMLVAVAAFTGCATTYSASAAYQTGPGYYWTTEPWPDYGYWWPEPFYYHHVGPIHHHFARDFDHDHDFDHGHALAHEHGFGHEGHEHMGHGHAEVHGSHHRG